MCFPRVCVRVCVRGWREAPRSSPLRGSPGSGGAERSVPGASARAAPPGAGEPRPQRPGSGARPPSSLPAGGGGWEPGAAALPGTLRGRGFPIPPPLPKTPPPSPSGLQSRRRAGPAAAGSLRPCRGWVFQARHVFAFPQDLPPGRDGGWDGGRRGQEPAGPRRGCGGPPRWENGGCRPREALTGLCLAGCRSWKGCGEGGRRREGPRLHPLFITMQLLRDDFGVKLFTSKWGSSLRGALASGCLGPACINAEQQRSRRKPWDVPQNAQDSHHPCLRCRTEHQWLFFGQYGP